MRTIVDFHIHSKYSRATSKNLDLKEIAHWSRLKGIDVVSCGDFTHPKWFSEIQSTLRQDGSGLLVHPHEKNVRFILATEVACIYKHRGATRRLHHILLAPSVASVQRVNDALVARGCNIRSDGRPILGLSSRDLLELVLEADPRNALIPAHIWTPWFALFGSKSGYDRLEDCFEDLSGHIFALETGLSSDPAMNWTLSALDKYVFVSNSDAHSGPKLGREANVFDLERLSYDAIIDTMRSHDAKRFLYTIEFYPEEGMYHFDGHRACNVSLAPNETKKAKGTCTVCKKPLTVGVLNRVDNLRDRNEGERPKNAIPFKSIVPLPEMIAEYLGVQSASKRVMSLYGDMVSKGGSEFQVLLDHDVKVLQKLMPAMLAEGIMRMRRGEVSKVPGYDGNYGKISVFSPSEVLTNAQARLL